MKTLTYKCEKAYFNTHEDKHKASKFSVSDRLVHLTHYVAKVWRDLHEFHHEMTINTFKDVGLSLNSNCSKY